MKRKIITHYVLATLLMFPSVVLANEVYEVQDFVVSGVQLGDDADTVIKALTEFFEINADDLEISREYEGPAIEYVEFNANGGSVIAYLEPDENGEADSSGKVPDVLVLFTVLYDEPMEDHGAYAETLIQQYGPPSKTLVLPSRRVYAWCEKFDADIDDCDQEHPILLSSDTRLFYGVN